MSEIKSRFVGDGRDHIVLKHVDRDSLPLQQQMMEDYFIYGEGQELEHFQAEWEKKNGRID